MKSNKVRIIENIIIDDDGCWNWQKYKNPFGYGMMMTGSRKDGTRKLKLVHRVAYEEWVGLIPHGFEADHLCKNRACCNPKHLKAVTHQQNCETSNHDHLALPRPWRRGIPQTQKRTKVQWEAEL